MLLLPALSLFSQGLFAGIATGISFIQHPRVLHYSTDDRKDEAALTRALADWSAFYDSAVAIQRPLAVASILLSFTAFTQIYGLKGKLWLAQSLLMGSVFVFTLGVIRPVNKQLKQLRGSKALKIDEQAEAKGLLKKWGRQHAVRTILSIVSFSIGIYALASDD
jgi:Domain of unknown function (DUF1772)